LICVARVCEALRLHRLCKTESSCQDEMRHEPKHIDPLKINIGPSHE
jgi:hypothetical protein